MFHSRHSRRSRLHSPALPCANSMARGSRGPAAAPSPAKGPVASHRCFGFIFVRAGPKSRAGCGPLRVPSPQACLRARLCHRSKSTRAAPGVCAVFPRSPCSCCRAISFPFGLGQSPADALLLAPELLPGSVPSPAVPFLSRFLSNPNFTSSLSPLSAPMQETRCKLQPPRCSAPDRS